LNGFPAGQGPAVRLTTGPGTTAAIHTGAPCGNCTRHPPGRGDLRAMCWKPSARSRSSHRPVRAGVEVSDKVAPPCHATTNRTRLGLESHRPASTIAHIDRRRGPPTTRIGSRPSHPTPHQAKAPGPRRDPSHPSPEKPHHNQRIRASTSALLRAGPPSTNPYQPLESHHHERALEAAAVVADRDRVPRAAKGQDGMPRAAKGRTGCRVPRRVRTGCRRSRRPGRRGRSGRRTRPPRHPGPPARP
jgi:hypothetical protein